jgi:uncharacterized membrane protein YkoI
MTRAGWLCLAFVLGCIASEPAKAAEKRTCLSPEQRRAVLATRKAVPLARAMRTVRARIAGDVVNARLCQQDKRLFYVLTVLARDGKVTEARVDAADGRWLDGS